MSYDEQLERVLSNQYNDTDFLNLAGNLAGDKLGNLVEDIYSFPSSIAKLNPVVYRGSKKGTEVIGIYAIKLPKSILKLSAKSRRLIANYLINENSHPDAIVAFYSEGLDYWRLGFVRSYKYDALESLREFLLGVGQPIKTALLQLDNPELNKKVYNLPASTELAERQVKLNDAFSIEAVSDKFYDEFKNKHFDAIVTDLKDSEVAEKDAEDLAVLFFIRIMFLGFVQQKKWLNNDEKYLQNLLTRYKQQPKNTGFYKTWLKPLFFEALNGFGKHIAETGLPKEIADEYKMLPYLNGGLYLKHGVDNSDVNISDELIEKYFTFLFSYNFTIEENTQTEQSLELNPELLGIIFERLVNKSNGAVYTPRTEVDFMCRISLVKWLQKNIKNDAPDIKELYELFFKEKGSAKEYEDDQKYGSFSNNQKLAIKDKLTQLSICDPAVGSGAFPVGMMQVLNETLEILGGPIDPESRYNRKKDIIGRNLYGVEVNEWAVWICQLRLWLSMFIDAPDELKNSFQPILPNLDFKILQGDSLVQRIGTKLVPIDNHKLVLGSNIAKQVGELITLKTNYFNNVSKGSEASLAYIHNKELMLAKGSLQKELQDTNQQITSLKVTAKHEQQDIFGNSKPQNLQLLETGLEILNRNRDELQDMLDNLKHTPTTIWNISFAEVFVGKGGFDIIIGNPPYIRQEDISDPMGNLAPKKYKELLAEIIRLDYWRTKNNPQFIKASGYNASSDLLIYFYLHSLKLLNSNGIHTFITQNSWLDVQFGAWFQKKLLSSCQVYAVFDSSRRTFKNAATNTIISVIHAPSRQTPKQVYKFVMLKSGYEKNVFTEQLLVIEKSDTLINNNDFRSYPITPTKLYNDSIVDNQFKGDKWGGKYLRAPDVFVKIIEKGKDKLTKLGDIAEVRFGIKTGANDFFYLDNEAVKNRSIEDRYLIPIIKSPKEVNSIIVRPASLKYRAFYCNKELDDIKGTNAEKYIRWGERHDVEIKQGSRKGETVKGYHNLATVKNRARWYELPGGFGARNFIQMSYGDVHRSFYTKDIMYADARLYEIKTSKENAKLLSISMNSTLTGIFYELYGRANLGDGALDFKVYEAKMILMADPILFKNANIPETLLTRKINNVFIECGIEPESEIPIEKQEPNPLPDRAALDKIVFDALGLTGEECKDVYRAVCRLVWNRISKAKSV